MFICIKTISGVHCYDVVAVRVPLVPPKVGPINYPPLFRDATIVATIQEIIGEVADAGVREALTEGVKTAAAALERRGGDHIKITLEGSPSID
jgi:hypothetical protein